MCAIFTLKAILYVDYFKAINVHTQPLDLQCQWRLVQKHVSQSLVDKRGKAMLPA